LIIADGTNCDSRVILPRHTGSRPPLFPKESAPHFRALIEQSIADACWTRRCWVGRKPQRPKESRGTGGTPLAKITSVLDRMERRRAPSTIDSISARSTRAR
jgi:hypothetical protein